MKGKAVIPNKPQNQKCRETDIQGIGSELSRTSKLLEGKIKETLDPLVTLTQQTHQKGGSLAQLETKKQCTKTNIRP
jgi:hypothetical protein